MAALAPAGAVRIVSQLYSGYILDLDGTVYLGDELLPGSYQLITTLRAHGCRTVFLSNNPTRDPQMYSDTLTRLGLPTPVGDIVNPLVTLTSWLRDEAPDAALFVIGEEPLVRTLTSAGFRLTDRPEDIDIVVASYDRTFHYGKLQIAFDALWQYRQARLVTTNPDAYCPMAGGRGEPDAAAIVAAIEASTGVRCEVNVGKPSPLMLRTAVEALGLPATECVVVGDRLYTDIAMAVDAGIDSALVLTGEGTRSMVDALPVERRPTFVLERIDDLLPAPRVEQRTSIAEET
jgi:HAD superfamily hydrolase (TIGR01450 family)